MYIYYTRTCTQGLSVVNRFHLTNSEYKYHTQKNLYIFGEIVPSENDTKHIRFNFADRQLRQLQIGFDIISFFFSLSARVFVKKNMY